MKKLLKKLIQAETTAQNGELAAAEIIAAELERSGIGSSIDSWDTSRANITARIKSAGRRAGLLFGCHLDVVPPGEAKWQYPPFAGTESNGKIHGRGSADMKGPIAAVVTAIRQIVDSAVELEGDIILFAAAGEETDSCGAKRFVSTFANQSPRFCGVIIPEPTDFEVVTAHRGLLWLKAATKGRTAHGSTPQLGINAISSMRELLDELENYKDHKLSGDGSMSVNTIAGGKALNVIPDHCDIGIDIRTAASQNHQELTADFDRIFVKLKQKNPQFKAEVSVIRDVPALETDSRSDFVKDFCLAVGVSETRTVGFTTDGPYFASLGAPVVIFGPGTSDVCHKPDEYIEIADVEKAVEHYKNIILRFLA